MATFNAATTVSASSPGSRAAKNSVSQTRERVSEMVHWDAAFLQHHRKPPHVVDKGSEDPELQCGSEKLQVVADIFPARHAAALPERPVEGRDGQVEPVNDRLDGLVVQGEKASQALRTRERGLFLVHV